MLTDKFIVITGGCQGIGFKIAESLVEDGATVIVTSRKLEFNNSSIKLNSINKQSLDVTKEESVKQFFDWVSRQSIKLTTLINNAGVGYFKSFLDLSLNEWQAMINTNLTGAFLCSKYSSLLMKENGIGGRIINIGSVIELQNIEYNSGYGASKSGLRAMSLVVSEELNKYNITSTHISLGAVHSDIWQDRPGFNQEDMLNVTKVANIIKEIVKLPFDIRMDNLEITPPKKIL